MAEAINPYGPPKAEVADVVAVTEAMAAAEAIRKVYFRGEAMVRSFGAVYCFAGIVIGGLVVAVLADSHGHFRNPRDAIIYLALCPVLAVLAFFVGRGLLALRPWARTMAVLFAFVILLDFPIGTLISGYILYLLLSEKGRRIFRNDYGEIVAATPHIKFKIPLRFLIVLGVFGLLLAAGLAFAIYQHH